MCVCITGYYYTTILLYVVEKIMLFISKNTIFHSTLRVAKGTCSLGYSQQAKFAILRGNTFPWLLATREFGALPVAKGTRPLAIARGNFLVSPGH